MFVAFSNHYKKITVKISYLQNIISNKILKIYIIHIENKKLVKFENVLHTAHRNLLKYVLEKDG